MATAAHLGCVALGTWQKLHVYCANGKSCIFTLCSIACMATAACLLLFKLCGILYYVAIAAS